MANVNPYTSDIYADMMQYETERDIERIKRRLATEYKQAERELRKKWKQYTRRFELQDKEKAKQVKSGALSKDDYMKWRAKKVLDNDMLEQQIDRMADYIVNIDQQSADIVNGERYGVYANNYNYARYEIEKGFHIDTSFSLFDQKTVERLAKDNPKLLPTMKPDKIKGKKWSKRAINNAISQGVLQGKSLPEVAKNLERVVGMEWNSAVRSARTAMTGAQNAGRVASYMDAKKLGIDLRKVWVATLDLKTRNSHASMDGESVPVDKKFSNKLMYPADPDGKPAEVYNCRCTLIAELVDYPQENFQRYDNIDGKPIDYVTYDEWKDAKQITTKRISDVPFSKSTDKYYNDILHMAQNRNVEYNPVKETVLKNRSDDDIIETIAGADQTAGSCCSAAFAYIGNLQGWSVKDFRGGDSQHVFASLYSLKRLSRMKGIKSIRADKGKTDYTVAKNLLKECEDGKLYFLAAGKHGAMVRKTDGVLEYLELQSAWVNGWLKFRVQGIDHVLKRRFGCATSSGWGNAQEDNFMIDVYGSNFKTDEFRSLLGFINTDKGKQMKGVGGHAK